MMNATPAIVLRALPFKEYDRILTLFSPVGIIKLFIKNVKQQWLRTAALTAPLTEGEFHYLLGKNELHRFVEGSILRQNLRLRESYESLVAAEKMIQALLDSQWTGKPALHLYQLFSLFLEHLPESEDPFCFSTTFLLKIIKYEGILQIADEMSACSRFAGERYDSTAPSGAVIFDKDEETCLTELTLCRSLNQLSKYKISTFFTQKIESLFLQSFKN